MHPVMIGGSDAGISAALRARELDASSEVTVVAADAYPNFSISGIPPGTTAHHQGRVADENALGGDREFAGSRGTQVLKIFDQAATRTRLRDHEAATAGFEPVTVASEADDLNAFYPGSHPIAMRVTGDRITGQLLGMQLFGHKHAEIARRIDIAATALFHGMTFDAVSDLDLSYTAAAGRPWEAVQAGAQAWARQVASVRSSSRA